MKHIDLFAGIGGFSYAFDQVFYEQENEHIFVEWEAFPQAVLRKHWPEAEIHGDIREFVANADGGGIRRHKREGITKGSTTRSGGSPFILSGGFPCQPFSHAGRRKGTADDRYLWPPMLDAIALFRPQWVIAENVAGLASWNEGLVLETVCTDLEAEGYEVQPFIIPACAVQAPHRRDRVWIVANRTGDRRPRGSSSVTSKKRFAERSAEARKLEGGFKRPHSDAPDTTSKRSRGLSSKQRRESKRKLGENQQEGSSLWGQGKGRAAQWDRHWREIALATCYDGVDDGLPRRMDGATISAAKHRNERLKACGNAIVPQVAMQIMLAIKDAELLTP